MDKFNEHLEIISAYADSELTGPEKNWTQELINKSEESSALYEMCREITGVVSDSLVPVPDELRDGVMGAITSPGVRQNTNRKPFPRVLFTRYMPVAACLAAALLVWSFRDGLFNAQYTGSGGSADSIHIQSNVYDFDAAPEMAMDTGGGEFIIAEEYSEDEAIQHDDLLSGVSEESGEDLPVEQDSIMRADTTEAEAPAQPIDYDIFKTSRFSYILVQTRCLTHHTLVPAGHKIMIE